MQDTLLIVDDNKDNLESLRMGFERLNKYNVITALGGLEAVPILKETSVDVIVSDLKMPEIDGMALLKFTQQLTPKPSLILLTAYGTIESAVEALQEGAFTYLTKPVNLNELRIQVEKAMQHQRLMRENFLLHSELKQRFGLGGMVGQTKVMEDIFSRIRQIANTKATVLIQGESGTGKELVARAVHYNSNRESKPFIPVHCAALSETLLESELFGHEKGAFTGAIQRHIGRFELADGGTLFLDEITEIPLSVQVKLLRVLEAKEFMRVGGVKPVTVDIRLITATNRNLEKEVEHGNFREDLYYRLKVVSIDLPPLRERKDDIPLLVKHFIDEIAKEHGKHIAGITEEAMSVLTAYSWLGNIRELRNCIENIVIFSTKETIDVNDLPSSVKGGVVDTCKTIMKEPILPSGVTLEEIEKDYIIKALQTVNWNKTKAAQILGISRRTLHRKLNEMNIPEEPEQE